MNVRMVVDAFGFRKNNTTSQYNVGLNNKKNRDEWLQKTLLKIPPGSRILDAGAGELRYRPYCAHLNYVSQDFGKYDGKGDGAGLQTEKWDCNSIDIISDITQIPEPDESFDAIMCIEVFEHIPEPIKAINEFKRLLKPNGFLIVTAPFCSLTHMAPYHMYSGFNQYFYKYHLSSNDFIILDMIPNGNYFEYIAQELYRIPEMVNRYSPQKKELLIEIEPLISHIMSYLESFSSSNNGSEDLLCFAYLIFAQKKSV